MLLTSEASGKSSSQTLKFISIYLDMCTYPTDSLEKQCKNRAKV